MMTPITNIDDKKVKKQHFYWRWGLCIGWLKESLSTGRWENVGFVNSSKTEQTLPSKCVWQCSSHTQTKNSLSVWRTDVCTVNWHLSGAVSRGLVEESVYLITAEWLQASQWLSVSIYVCLYGHRFLCSAQHLCSLSIAAFLFSLSFSLVNLVRSYISLS